MERRKFMSLTGILAASIFAAPKALAESFTKINKPDSYWKKKLTEMQYYVLGKEGTERSFTSPLNNEKRKGTFVCAGCELPLFKSKYKYDSGTGWPSFYDAVDKSAIREIEDNSLGMKRVEIKCSKCEYTEK